MQRPNYLVVTTNTTTAAYPLDRYTNGYGFSVTLSKTTMTATYTLQYSMLSPFEDTNGEPYTTSYKVSGNWQQWDDPLLVGASTSRSTNMAFPARAVRMITSNVSGGSLTFSIVPMGMDAA